MIEKYAYTSAPGKLREFLKGLPSRGVPDKITQKYLESIGMKSKSDRTIVTALKFVKLLDGSGAPTENYRLFRDQSRGPAVLASLIHNSYSELYKVYEDAHNQNDTNLRNFFKTQSDLGESAINYQIATFKALCDFADFGSTPKATTNTPQLSQANPEIIPSMPSFHIDMHIHLPDSKDPLVHDAIFQAIARHIMKGT